MPRYFTHYWGNDTVEAAQVSGEDYLEYVAGNQFVMRGVEVGDTVYPISVVDGVLFLVGRLEVGSVCDLAEARDKLGYDPDWKASDYLLANNPSPTYFDLEVPLEVTRRLRFVAGSETEPAKFVSLERLDRQTMRGVRELTQQSASELEKLLPSMSGPRLIRYEDYSREEVHDIFAPEAPFTLQRGTWGLHGIVAIPDRPGDYVFFVTLGQQQGDHVFDEGITENGVLSWQSQPRQGLNDAQIREFIEHDELQNSIYLFFRTKKRIEYTYFGRLKYLSHDTEREKPVYFQWQILDWDPPAETLERMDLILQSSETTESGAKQQVPTNRLQETPPPVVSERGARTTPSFRARKTADYSTIDATNRELGLAGELLVVEHEKQVLEDIGRRDLARRVRHTSIVEGDGAGYDILSFTPQGETKYIEVKTTRGRAETPFFLTTNEVEFSLVHEDSYHIYRVYDYRGEQNSGSFYVYSDSPKA